MKKLIFILINLNLVLVIALAQNKNSFYVSPDGKDSNPGTLNKPFLTINRAQEEVQKFNKDNNIYVYLRGGEYKLEKSLLFNPEDGGLNGHEVIYAAYEDEIPVIHGGEEIKNWRVNNNGIWIADYDKNYFRQLYINGHRRVRARHPNKGNYFRINGFDFKNEEILVGRKDIDGLQGEENLEMILQMHWAESILRVSKLTNEGGHMKAHNGNIIIHPDDAAIFFVRPNPNHRTGQSYHFENSISFLDQPGEWFFDTKNKKVYYMPLKGETPENSKVMVPVIIELIKIEGKPDERVKNLIFEGITFKYSNWTRPGNKPYLNVQAGFYNCYADSTNEQKVLRPASAIHITWAEDVQFKVNKFKNLGSTALDFNYGTKNCRITGNVISDISGGGILIGKFVEDSLTSINLPYNPTDKRIVSTDDIVSNNFITRTGLDYYGTCGIAAGYTDGLVVAHNYLYDLPYTGISIGYGWTDELSAMKNSTVANNNIEKVMNMMADGGGIYTLSKQPGTVIKNNYIHNLKKSPWASPWPMVGIYLDYMSGGTLEEPMVLEQNLVDMKEGELYKATYAGVVLHVYNIFNNNGSEAALEIIDNAGLEPEFRHFVGK